MTVSQKMFRASKVISIKGALQYGKAMGITLLILYNTIRDKAVGKDTDLRGPAGLNIVIPHNHRNP